MKTLYRCLLAGAMFAVSALLTLRAAPESVWLSAAVDVHKAQTELAGPRADQSAQKQPLRVAGQAYAHGVGTQLETFLALNVNGATRFTALAGVDDATDSEGAVIFAITADGQTLWRSPELHRGQAPVAVEVELHGHQQLILATEDAGHAQSKAYADWLEAKFTLEGEKPAAMDVPIPAEKAVILTPPAPATPRINGARVFGVRPGSPFLYTIAATGERPMKFGAEGLPAGLHLDGATGRITGELTEPGTHVVKLTATNARGTAERSFKIVVGDTIALTPPMGWNSWNCWGPRIDQEKVLHAAQAMAASGLIDHGWTYINIDDAWQAPRGGKYNALQGNKKFPDLQKLCAEVHALGLKIGIYSTPWVTSYAGYPGGSADNPEGEWDHKSGTRSGHVLGQYSFAVNDAQQWATWGIDYLKYDWNPNEIPETRNMANALRTCRRDIVYSLSNSAPFHNAAGLSALANCWRTTGDIRDNWGRIVSIWSSQNRWHQYASPGHWNDPDMLVVGEVFGWGNQPPHPSHLTPNEQYTHITLWSLLSAPLLIGCDLNHLDAFTLNLLTNDEVLAVDQDPLGRQATEAAVDGRRQVWVKELADGSRAIGLFNLARQPDTITVTWKELGLEGPQSVRDLWRQKDLGVYPDKFSAEVPRHGTMLIRIRPAHP